MTIGDPQKTCKTLSEKYLRNAEAGCKVHGMRKISPSLAVKLAGGKNELADVFGPPTVRQHVDYWLRVKRMPKWRIDVLRRTKPEWFA